MAGSQQVGCHSDSMFQMPLLITFFRVVLLRAYEEQMVRARRIAYPLSGQLL